jgi:flagellar basal-body rod modification protein FlgD
MVPAVQSNPVQTASASASGGDTNANTVDYNQFLQLLIAQLRNQDPTSPTDPTQFVSQLASFSGVEQQVKANSKLDTLITNASLGQAGAILGRTVSTADGAQFGPVTAVQITSGALTALTSDGRSVPLSAVTAIS